MSGFKYFSYKLTVSERCFTKVSEHYAEISTIIRNRAENLTFDNGRSTRPYVRLSDLAAIIRGQIDIDTFDNFQEDITILPEMKNPIYVRTELE